MLNRRSRRSRCGVRSAAVYGDGSRDKVRVVMAFAFDDPWSLMRSTVLVLVITIWVTAILVIGVKGGDVDRVNRVSHLYGYTVCLVALITVLMTLPAIVDNFFTLGNPVQGETRFGFGASLGSFEAYKASQRQGAGVAEALPGRAAPVEPPPSEEELRRRYEALRADQIASNLYNARRSLVRNGIVLALALGLFLTHWRWLRRTPAQSSGGAAA